MHFHKKPAIFPGEVYLKVTNIERSQQFYTEVIGLKVLEKENKKVSFTANGKDPLLVIEQPDGVLPKETRKAGLYHLALLLPKRSDLSKVLVHLLKNEIKLGAADHLVSEALYLSDPDDNGIEIYIDRDASEWKWIDGEVAMGTDPLDGDGLIAESAEQVWDGLPTGTIIGHVHLHVKDLPETEAFYQKLGFEVVCHYPQALFMSNEKYHHHIGLNTWNGEGAAKPSENSAGLHAFTLIYPDRDALENAIKQVDSEAKINNNEAIIQDPSGNSIMLRWN